MSGNRSPQGNEQQQFSFGLLAQYLKDLSFENPDPLAFFEKGESVNLSTQVNFDLTPKKIGETRYLASMRINVVVKRGEKDVYCIDMVYEGLFDIVGANQDLLKILLFVEAPRFLFPFMRSQIVHITQESGFPPLTLSAFDFSKVFGEKLQQDLTL